MSAEILTLHLSAVLARAGQIGVSDTGWTASACKRPPRGSANRVAPLAFPIRQAWNSRNYRQIFRPRKKGAVH